MIRSEMLHMNFICAILANRIGVWQFTVDCSMWLSIVKKGTRRKCIVRVLRMRDECIVNKFNHLNPLVDH